jgi:hypothetical protein
MKEKTELKGTNFPDNSLAQNNTTSDQGQASNMFAESPFAENWEVKKKVNRYTEDKNLA